MRVILGGRGSFWELSNEKEGFLIDPFKGLQAPIIMGKNILNYFGSCLKGWL